MMCSIINVSDATSGKLCDTWEKELWANVLSPSQNPCNNSQNQLPEPHAIQHVSVGDFSTATTQYNETTTLTSYCESSTLLSPTWDNSTSPVQNSTYPSMSSYFSSFDPSAQCQDAIANQDPVLTTSSNAHRARISFVPSENGAHTPVVKRKRKRTVFSTEQVEVLEEVFSKKPYVSRNERQKLVERLQVNDKSVKIWFQNRRLKNKRGDEQYEMMESENDSNIFERLNSVEAKLYERVDEFGYVTLDDQIMSELVNVIDDYFANKDSIVEPKTEIYSSPMYEPISPASIDDNSYDCGTNWEHQEPSYTAQDLMDIESIISM